MSTIGAFHRLIIDEIPKFPDEDPATRQVLEVERWQRRRDVEIWEWERRDVERNIAMHLANIELL